MTRVQCSLILALAIAFAAPLSAQNRIILKPGPGIGAFGDPVNGMVTLTLESGTRITVPTTDLDIRLMTQIAGAQPAGSASEALLSPSQSDAILTRKCQGQWKGDFKMQSYCIDQQKDAVRVLQRRTMASPDQRTIRAKCATDWPDDFKMRDYCETQQLEALAKLRR